jgi:glycerophosphoryl diester phosphodiesterase
MTRRTVLVAVAAGVTAAPVVEAPQAFAATRIRPVVIGHRGASGYRPEHTLASYELAARMGADFLEPDLVVTKDGVLVCRHEPEIGGTTDVADHPEFASRRKTVTLDGVSLTGWFTEDFTLTELKTLRAKERLPLVRQHNTLWDGVFEVPTFAELLELRQRLTRELGREVGVYPETKHPTYFERIGLPLEARLLHLLWRHGLNRSDSPVVVQSFEVSNLKELRRLGLRTRCTQLLSTSGAPFDTVAAGAGPTYADLMTRAGLRSIARYAQGIGPDKLSVIPLRADGTLGEATSLVADAHDAGLVVHPYTFRAENTFLPAELRIGTENTDFGSAVQEQRAYFLAGIDGLFADQPDLAVFARNTTEAVTSGATR